MVQHISITLQLNCYVVIERLSSVIQKCHQGWTKMTDIFDVRILHIAVWAFIRALTLSRMNMVHELNNLLQSALYK